jgi:hypothetical protein
MSARAVSSLALVLACWLVSSLLVPVRLETVLRSKRLLLEVGCECGVGRMEASSLGDSLRFAYFLVGQRKIGFESGPGLLVGGATAPVSAGVHEKAGL